MTLKKHNENYFLKILDDTGEYVSANGNVYPADLMKSAVKDFINKNPETFEKLSKELDKYFEEQHHPVSFSVKSKDV